MLCKFIYLRVLIFFSLWPGWAETWRISEFNFFSLGTCCMLKSQGVKGTDMAMCFR